MEPEKFVCIKDLNLAGFMYVLIDFYVLYKLLSYRKLSLGLLAKIKV